MHRTECGEFRLCGMCAHCIVGDSCRKCSAAGTAASAAAHNAYMHNRIVKIVECDLRAMSYVTGQMWHLLQ